MLDNLVCPISNVRIDRNVVRTNGLITTALLVAYVFTRSPLIIVPVGIDYVLRAMMNGPTSPMAHFARRVARTLGIPFRSMDKAPKVFASRIGVCFAMGAAIAHFVAPGIAPWLAGTLAVFTTLESVFDFCVGCVVYTYIALPLYSVRNAVRSIQLFGNLEDPMLVALSDGFESLHCPQGEDLMAEGTPGGELFVLRSGEVEVFHPAVSGPESVIATYKSGALFGEMALLTGRPGKASVRARTAVEVLRLQKADVEALFAKHPKMRGILERTVAEHAALGVASNAL
jgi:hypothetical protein